MRLRTRQSFLFQCDGCTSSELCASDLHQAPQFIAFKSAAFGPGAVPRASAETTRTEPMEGAPSQDLEDAVIRDEAGKSFDDGSNVGRCAIMVKCILKLENQSISFSHGCTAMKPACVLEEYLPSSCSEVPLLARISLCDRIVTIATDF